MYSPAMQVEQAVFTSTDSGKMKGYQLVSRSPGIDGRLAQELCHWAPTHASLLGTELDDWSLNYFPAGDGWVAITRTVYGGPEYSSRGGLQVVTCILALQVEQFAGYDYDALALARTALALGHLTLLPDTFSLSPQVPTIDLPRQPIIRRLASAGPRSAVTPPLTEALGLLRANRRVALVGLNDPIAALEHLIGQTPRSQRLSFSFTTGLKPSVRRGFQLQFLSESDVPLRSQLASQRITSVSFSAEAR